MEKLRELTRLLQQTGIQFASIVLLLLISVSVSAQTGTGSNDQGRTQNSPAEQSSRYLQSIEKDPNGVPNTSVWYAQPWIWAIVAAILILLIGVLFKSYGKRDIESERGM